MRRILGRGVRARWGGRALPWLTPRPSPSSCATGPRRAPPRPLAGFQAILSVLVQNAVDVVLDRGGGRPVAIALDVSTGIKERRIPGAGRVDLDDEVLGALERRGAQRGDPPSLPFHSRA